MRVLYVGVHSGKGWRTEYFVLRALMRLGCKVKCYNYRRIRKRIKEPIKRNEHLLKTEQKFRPDLILVQRADCCPPELFSPLTAKKVLWSTEPICRNRDVDQLLEANCFDHYFMHTDSCLDRLKQEFPAIVSKATRLDNGCPKEIIKKPQRKKSRFAIFNRSLSERRSKWFKESETLIEFISGRYGRKYFSDIRKSLISVNVHFGEESTDDFETGIFEAMAQGSMVLTEPVSEKLLSEMGLTKAVVQADSPQEMYKKLQHYKENPNEVWPIIEEAHRAIGQNTWDVRMKKIFSTIGLNQ